MAKVFVTDETNDSYTMDVLPSGAAEVTHNYTYAKLNSGTGSGVISTSNIILHRVIVAGSANLGQLFIGSNAASTDAAPGNVGSASAVAMVDLAARGNYAFDSYIPAVSTYRLTGLDCNQITVVYEVI